VYVLTNAQFGNQRLKDENRRSQEAKISRYDVLSFMHAAPAVAVRMLLRFFEFGVFAFETSKDHGQKVSARYDSIGPAAGLLRLQ
jgi:hypothetical protein